MSTTQEDQATARAERVKARAEDMLANDPEYSLWKLKNFQEAMQNMPDSMMACILAGCATAIKDCTLDNSSANEVALRFIHTGIKDYMRKVALFDAEKVKD